MPERVIAPIPFTKHSYDEAVYGLVFANILPAGVTISSLDSTTSTPSGLTITGGTPNSSSYTDDDGDTVAANTAIQATISGGTDGSTYTITFNCTLSDSSKRAGVVRMRVTDD